MDVRLTEDVGEFAAVAGPFLRSEPFTANVIAVEVEGVLNGRRTLHPGSLWILVEEDLGRPGGAAMHTPPFNLFLPRMSEGLPEAIAAALWDAGHAFPGVNGESGTVERFVHAWQARGGASPAVRRRTRMYVLGSLHPPEGVPGRGRLAGEGDLDLLVQWFLAFFVDTGNETRSTDIAEIVRRRLADGQLWLWHDDDEPVSLAGVSPPAVGVARVGPVYTPRRRRGRGYGSAVTALATAAAVDRGDANVVLYTDLSNPTSNAIYQEIGYVPDHDAEEREFVAG
jgi:predicted GNAT family acetyltransferase